MRYVGILTWQARNNARSVVLLCMFPCLVVLLTFLFAWLLLLAGQEGQEAAGGTWEGAWTFTARALPYVLGGVGLWFMIAYFANTAIIRSATGARPLERAGNKRVYNLVENLCMTRGMAMPRVNVIDDSSLNAHASGINARTYTVTLTRGLIDKLDDEELEGVIAHELTHIRNRDVRLLVVSIVFVGIFAMLAGMARRALFYSSYRGRGNNKNNGAILFLILIVVALVGYALASLTRFAISRKREYMADAGAAEMTRNPRALASALRKISADPGVEAIKRDDVAQLFIEHPREKSAINGLFATHPPIQKRIAILEQF